MLLRAARQSISAVSAGVPLNAARAYAVAARSEIEESEAESSSAPQRRQALAELSGARITKVKSPYWDKKLSKAKQLALQLRDVQGLEQVSDDGGRISRNTPDHGNQAVEANDQPTAIDLLSHRPRYPRDKAVYEPKYEVEYNKLSKSLDNAFIKNQLKRMMGELGMKMRIGRRTPKEQMIRAILLTWGWPPPGPQPLPKTTRINKGMIPA